MIKLGYLWRVQAPHFTAGLVTHRGKVRQAAPILNWTIGKKMSWLRTYFARKGYKAIRMTGPTVIRATLLHQHKF